MSSTFASGKHAIGICDRCGQRAKLTELRKQVVKGIVTNLKVCWGCLDEDHPQLMLGMYPVNDPQALRGPRPENDVDASRDIQWGWNPVGGSGATSSMTPNDLLLEVEVGDVTVATA